MMAGIHWLVIFMYIIHGGQVLGLDCEDNALGMQNNVIPADKITASSGTAGDQARLNYNHGPSWCAMGSKANLYLQIDLGTAHIICAVSTQGDHQAEQWVKTFQLNYSKDGKTYHPYKENNNAYQTFYGNVDNSGIIKQILYKGIIARYLRIVPMMHHGAVCMRAEIYGVQIRSENLAFNKTAKQSSTDEDGNASRAIDGNRDGNWLGGSCTHCDKKVEFQWWRVNLGISVEVEEVSVFSRTHPEWGLRLWNSTFELRIGHDDTPSMYNSRCGDRFGIIPAGSITIVCNPPINGRYVFITQKEQGQLSLCEVEVYGQALVCTRNSIGISNNKDQTISGFKLLASSMNSDMRSVDEARLLGNSSWRPRDNDTNPWLQIDLGEIYYVCAVATQGDPNSDERTRRYKIRWSVNNNTWQFVKNKTSNTDQVFTGNRDNSSIIKHHLSIPLIARKIRFYPLEKNIACALRVELYGIKRPGPPMPHLIGERKLDPRYDSHVDLTCRTDRGLNIKWYHNHTDITSYSIGTVRTGSILISTLRVNYTSADDVYNKYSCGDVVARKQNCTSLDYICQVDYGSYRKLQARGRVTVVLGVLNAPIVEIQQSARSALVKIKQTTKTADQNNIKRYYLIELYGQTKVDTNQSTYNLTGLKPNTNYTVRVMVSSRTGRSNWSIPVTFTTKQAS